MMYGVSQFGYLVASALFIFALHWMNTPATARKGVYAGVAASRISSPQSCCWTSRFGERMLTGR